MILIAAILPLVLGGQAQRAYQDLLAAALSPAGLGHLHAVRPRLVQFQRQLRVGPATPVRAHPAPRAIRLDSRIEQGPLTWFSRDGIPVLARVQTRVEWIDAAIRLPPLVITTHIVTDGSAPARLLVPAVTTRRRDDIGCAART